MILKNKKALLITSLLTLLPIVVGLLLWDRFPEIMAIHWGLTGQADGFSSVPFAVFVLPVIMLAVHWLCILATALDKGNKNRNQKMLRIVLWIIPVMSNLTCCLMYALALGLEFNMISVMLSTIGLLFAIIGNYLPKTRMNSTMGIKVLWAYTSEENWNATHRFAGKVWVIGGILMALCGFLPGTWAIGIMFAIILILCVVPVLYSYRFYKEEHADGKVGKSGYSAADKRILKGSGIFLILLTVFLLVILFRGEIDFLFREDYLLIDTNMYSDHVVYYDVIDSVEYRNDNVSGLRVGGYGSFRLLMGYFQNEEFGTYIRYTYYKPDACVVLTTHSKTIVLSGEDAESTRILYEELLTRTAN